MKSFLSGFQLLMPTRIMCVSIVVTNCVESEHCVHDAGFYNNEYSLELTCAKGRVLENFCVSNTHPVHVGETLGPQSSKFNGAVVPVSASGEISGGTFAIDCSGGHGLLSLLHDTNKSLCWTGVSADGQPQDIPTCSVCKGVIMKVGACHL